MNNVVLSFDEYSEKYKLGKVYQYTTRGNINIDDIVGSCHYDYVGKTFNQCLHSAKRIDIARKLFEKNPDYYFSDLPKDMSFYVFDFGNRKETFVQEGNHRVFIGKMLKSTNKDLLQDFNIPPTTLEIKIVEKEEIIDDLKGYKTIYEYYFYSNKTYKKPYIGGFLPESVKNGKVRKLIEEKMGFTYKLKKALGFV